MPATFRSISVGITTTTGTTSSVTCPSGVQTGDLLLFYAANDAPNVYSSATGGLTVIDSPTSETFDLGTGSWYKIATGSDVAGSTSYTFTKAGSSNAQPRLVVCLAYSGFDPSAWPLASTKHAYTQGSKTAAINAGTPCPTPGNPSSVAATDLVLRVYAFGSDVSGTGITLSGPPSGWTQRGTSSTTRTDEASKFNVALMICDRVGATDTATVTSNKKGSFDSYTIAIPALPPARNQFMPFFGM